jgi:2-methylisocitrate lyase-like PEP mutase family enzyme
MDQTEKGKRFAKLHLKGSPLLLYNAWDAGSARAVAEAGAKAIATSSWSVAEAQGYRDGELIPIVSSAATRPYFCRESCAARGMTRRALRKANIIGKPLA